MWSVKFIIIVLLLNQLSPYVCHIGSIKKFIKIKKNCWSQFVLNKNKFWKLYSKLVLCTKDLRDHLQNKKIYIVCLFSNKY